MGPVLLVAVYLIGGLLVTCVWVWVYRRLARHHAQIRAELEQRYRAERRREALWLTRRGYPGVYTSPELYECDCMEHSCCGEPASLQMIPAALESPEKTAAK